VETVCSWGVQWVSKAIQFKGLANGRESILDHSGFDLESLAESTLPCPFSKSLKDVNPFFWSKAMEVGIKTGPKECAPVTPITLVLHVICLHDAIGDLPVRSAEKTFPMVGLLMRHMSHEVPCGRGKAELMCERKAWSLGKVSKECGTKSANLFSVPGM